MAVYYKFKSARDYDSIAMDGPFISVGILKEKIFESKHLGRGTDFDLVVTNAQTNEEYLDEAALIPKNTSVLIRRVPGRPRMPIVTDSEPRVEDAVQNTEPEKSSFMGAGSSMNPEPDWDDLGGDLYEIPEVQHMQPNYVVPDIPPSNNADEESKLRALIENPVLDWQQQGPEGFGPGRGFGRGINGRMGGRGFGGRTGGFEKKTPPQGYICHRCKVPGHFIQHCPTNGDPNYDIKRVKAPTGIPRSMLQATPEGSYALPSGAVAVLRPNEAAFEKEIEGLPSTRSVGDLPPELHCPLCKEVMKDAVLTSKCCFKSFCDKCIRNYITSKSVCVCGDTNTLADDLLPNKTLRDAINRILESGNSSNDNPGSAFQVQDMESARPPAKIPSPTLSAASKGENKPSPLNEALKTQKPVDEKKPVLASQQMLENVRNTKIADASEATHDSTSVKEPASQGSAPLVDEEVQQRLATAEAGKKRKKKKVRMPANDMQWKSPQDLAAENYMMQMGPNAYNPYWNGLQPSMGMGMGMDGYMPPYGAPMPYMGYGMGPMDMPFGGPFPPDSFGGQGYMMPMPPPQRDLADFGMGMGMNVGPPPIMSREEFEARKADLRRKRENERRDQSREFPKDRDHGREIGGNSGVPPMKSKSKSSLARSPSPDYRDRDHHHRPHRYDRSSPEPLPREHRDRRASRDLVDPLPPPRPPKRKSDHHDREREPERESTKDYDYHEEDKPRQKRHRLESSSSKPTADTEAPALQSKASSSVKMAAEAASAKSKASVFSRISFPAGEANKKKKSSPPEAVVGGGSKEAVANGFHDDDHSSRSSKVAAAPSVSTSSRKSGVSSPAAVDYDSASDEDRHFKRKKKSSSSRYVPEASPKEMEVEEEPSRQHSRGSRDREREHRRQR